MKESQKVPKSSSWGNTWKMSLVAVFLAVTCGILGGLTAQVQAQEKAPSRPNIVLIMADDLGYGDLGCYGQARIQTPNLDKMARQGLRFTDFYAGSTVCAPSRCTLMTGYHSGHSWIRGNGEIPLRPSDVTLAQVLQKAGYRTALFGKWGLGAEGTDATPDKKGFDTYFGYLNHVHAHNYYPTHLWKDGKKVALKTIVPDEKPNGSGVSTNKAEYSHDLIAEQALAFLDEQRDQPFFMYVAFTLPHANNEAKKEGMEVPNLGIYENLDWPAPQKAHAAMISRMDQDVGRLLTKLKEKGLADNTIVLFTSDNGPHAEGGNDPLFNQSSGFLKGHKRSLTDGGIRVPLIVRWPGKIAADQKTDLISFNGDLFPTLAELAGASASVPKDIDGLSILLTLQGKPDQQKQHEYLYWAFYENGGGRAVRKGDWKLIEQPIGSPLRLYDLTDEVIEGTNKADMHPELVKELQTAMAAAYTPSDRWIFEAAGAKKAAKGKQKN